MTLALTRREALLSFGVLGAAAGLAGCNTTQTAGLQQAAASGLRIGSINVDTSGLLAQSGNPTASWVQQSLPGAIAQAFGPVVAQGDPGGATLTARVSSIYLGQGGPADPDIIRGSATLGGATPRQVKVRAISVYTPLTIDQTLWEQALQGRVTSLSQSFAYALVRRLHL
jgi:predicted small secreted protein